MKPLSRESRSLIDAARDGDDPSAADRKRVRTALARKVAIGVAAGAAAATATHAAAGGVAAAGTSGAAAGTAAIGAGAAAGVAGGSAVGTASIAAGAMGAGLGAKLLVSVAIVGALGAGTVGYARHEAAKRAETTRVVAVEQSAARPVAALVSPVAKSGSPPLIAEPPTLPPPESGGGEIEAHSPTTSPPVLLPPIRGEAGRGASREAPPPSTLDAELALLQEVHGALQTNDGARALRLLAEHSRLFPDGALSEESEAARVFALCQVGRAAEARDVAGRFLREHPRSPLAPRVTRACDAEPSTF